VLASLSGRWVAPEKKNSSVIVKNDRMDNLYSVGWMHIKNDIWHVGPGFRHNLIDGRHDSWGTVAWPG
jgi:hypothetical protein